MTLDEFKSYWRSLPGTKDDNDLLIESNYESGFYGVWSSRLCDKSLTNNDVSLYVKNIEFKELKELIKIKINIQIFREKHIQDDF